MRIISAHYAWDSSRGFVKNPLLYVNDNHEVVRLVGMGEAYVEHAHVEFFSGLIVPGFISHLNLEEVESSLDHHLNRCFAKGSIYVSIGLSNQVPVRFEGRVNPKVLLSKTIDSSSSPWDQICERVKMSNDHHIESLLRAHLYQPWERLGRLDLGGSFNEKTKSGVLVLNGINWQEMTFTPNLSFKIVHIPY